MPPSIFLSYASEDRVAARRLRDALTDAGLEVWYDEDELAGGDAWDQKIRRQIRECTYFMPLISAATERRREGYFRREWRLATERTLDMADDLLFLLPIAIDNTRDDVARVPDKFREVQWLRCPAGEPTPAFDALAQRLLAGDATPPPVPRAADRSRRRGAASKHADGPLAMPPFPSPRPDHRLRYFAEVFWWAISAILLLYRRLPRFLRWLVLVWVCLTLFSALSRDDRPDRKPAPREDKTTTASSPVPASPPSINPTDANDPTGAVVTGVSGVTDPETLRQLQEVANELERSAAANPGSLGSGLARLGSKFVRDLTQVGPARGPHRLVVPKFDRLTTDAETAALLEPVFNSLFGRLAVSLGTDLGLLAAEEPLTDEAALARAAASRDRFILLGRGERDAAGAVTLRLRLLAVADAREIWAGDYALADRPADEIAQTVADAVNTILPP